MAAKANQNPPIRKYEKRDRDAAVHFSMSLNSPMVPKTTQGKVLPRMNSRILVIRSNKPPRKTMGPLFSLLRLTAIVMLAGFLLHECHPISTGASPSHQTARNWSCSNNKSTESSEIGKTIRLISAVHCVAYSQWRRVSNSLGKFRLTAGHRGQVKLLKLLG